MRRVGYKIEETIKNDRYYTTYACTSQEFEELYNIFDMNFYKEIYIKIIGTPLEAWYNVEDGEFAVSNNDRMYYDNLGFEKLCKYLKNFKRLEFTLVSRIDY